MSREKRRDINKKDTKDKGEVEIKNKEQQEHLI